MAEKFYSQWTQSDLAGATAQNIGWLKIYKNNPVYIVKYDYEWNGAKFWWKLNDYAITTEDALDDSSYYTLWYGSLNTSNPSNAGFGASGDQYVSGDKYFNTVLPWNTKTSTSSATSTRPSTGNNDIDFSSYHKGWITWWAFGDQESFAVTLKGKWKDNYFNKNISSIVVDRSNNQVLFNMAAALPSLINADKADEDIASSDRVACDTSNRYIIPLDANKHYRIENTWSNPSKSSDDKVHLKIEDISFYNSNIYIKPHQLGSISSFGRDKNKLTWNAVTNANKYNIYVDGVYYTNVNTASWTIPDDLYIDQKHTYSVEVCDKVSESHKYKSVTGKKTPNASESSFIAERESTFNI